MRNRLLLPIALVVALVVVLPTIGLTETGVEKDLKEAAGFDLDECEASVNEATAWVEGPSLPFLRDEPRAAVIDGKVYLVGGTLDVRNVEGDRPVLTATDALTRFDPRSGRYEELAPLPEALNHVDVATYRGDLYVLGGYGESVDSDTRDSFYRYDPERDRWSRLPDLPQPRAAGAVGVIGDTLYLAGGARNSHPRDEVFAFDLRRGRWSRLPDMPTGREHVGAAVVGGKLYVLGGRRTGDLSLATAERFDPRSGRWERLPPMPVPAGGLAAIDWRGRPIAVAGGDDGAETVTGAVQEFDPATGEWRRLPDLRVARHGHGAALVGDRLWVFGGSDCAYFNGTDSVEFLDLAALSAPTADDSSSRRPSGDSLAAKRRSSSR